MAEEIRTRDRVLVRELDVFGRVIGIQMQRDVGAVYSVQCEWPKPGYVWKGSADNLQPAGGMQ